MHPLPQGLIAGACLMASMSLGCNRGSENAAPRPSGEPKSAVRDDLQNVGKATEKAAKDIGHATADLADKAGQRLEDVSNKAAGGSQDAWITTKVKSALTSAGLDALHVHVDTEGQVVTLSGSVDSAAQKAKAVGVAKNVAGVRDIQDHLFVKPAGR